MEVHDAAFGSNYLLKESTDIYAEIRAKCKGEGYVDGPNDLLIATIVMASNGTLVTRNTKEFSRVPGLNLVEW